MRFITGSLSIGVLAAFLAIVSPLKVAAQSDPTEPEGQKGFTADGSYHLGGSDNVNVFNGNLVIAIPLGQTYPVNHFSYGLHLTYNSTLWTSEVLPGPAESIPSHRGIPNVYSNAGFGWYFDAGPMWPDCVKNCELFSENAGAFFRTSDGGTHSFWKSLHADEPETAGFGYTRDGTYMRSKAEGGVTWFDSPEGTRERLSSAALGGYNYARFDEKRDWFGNNVTYDYSHANEVWMTDSAGRVQKIRFTTYPTAPADSDPQLASPPAVNDYPPNYQYLPSQVELAAFGGHKLFYNFTYEIHKVPRNQLYVSGPGLPANEPLYDSLPFLVRLEASDDAGNVLQTWTFDYNYANAIGESGTLKKMTVPTGGTYDYTYSKYITPGSACSESGGGSVLIRVATRTVDDKNGASGTWTYTPRVRPQTEKIPLLCSPGFHPTDYPPEEEMTVQVTPPFGARTVNYFSLWKEIFDSYYGTRKGDDGLPFTRRVAVGGKFLSSEEFDCTKGTCQADCTVPGACPLARSTYVRYERDFNTLLHNANNRMAESAAFFHDDPASCVPSTNPASSCRFMNALSSNFDGLGHYRQTDVTSNFPSAHAKKSFTHFTGTLSTYGVDAQGNRLPYSMFAEGAPWLPGLYDEQWSEENGTATRAFFKFNPSNGSLTSTQLPKAPGATHDDIVAGTSDDLFTTYCYIEPNHVDNFGSLQRERHYGGDGVTFNAGVLPCATAPVDSAHGEYEVDYTYSNGVRSTATIAGSGFLNLNRTVDLSTGLTLSSKDASDLQTSFEYDVLARLLWRKPQSGSWTQVLYAGPDAANPKPTVYVNEFPNGTSSGVPTTEAKHEFDGLGRPWREWRRMHDGGWSVRQTLANIENWTTSVSELDTTPQHFTTFSNFDGFGRTQLITAPDNSTTSLAYTGTSEVQRTTAVRTGGDATTFTTTPAKTTEDYDNGGRLVRIKEPNEIKTSYTYDVSGHLTRVCMNDPNDNGTSCGQTRLFAYDNRGFLTSETHPERGVTGNGTTRHGEYDAFGHAHRKVDGIDGSPYDVQFDFDSVGRPKEIKTRDSLARTIKQFTYGTDNVGSNRLKGKLQTAVRFNWFDINGVTYNIQVAETYSYSGVGGRPDSRRTDEFDCTVSPSQPCTTLQTTPTRTFFAGFTYDDSGQTTSIAYPTCSVGCGNVVGARTVTNAYTRGFLSAVTFPYSGGTRSENLSYLPNGMVKLVEHANHVKDAQTSYFGTTRVGSISSTGSTDTSSCPISIGSQPGSVTIAPGQSTSLAVTASGSTSLKYEWFDGARGDASHPLTPGGGTSTFTTPALTASKMYWVHVTDLTTNCPIDSNTALVVVCNPAQIVSGISQYTGSVRSGSHVIMTVGATGYNLVYVWTRYLKSNPGAVTTLSETGPTLDDVPPSTTPPVVPEYIYTVTVHSNIGGPSACTDPVSSSADITLTTCDPPTFDWDLPISRVIPVGISIDLEVRPLVSHGTVTYEWFKKSGKMLTTPSTNKITIGTHPNDWDVYYVRMTDECGTSESQHCHVKQVGSCPLPPLTVSRKTIDVNDDDMTFVANIDWVQLEYHWYRGQTGDTRSEVTGSAVNGNRFTAPKAAGNYWVRVKAECGTTLDSDTLQVVSGSCIPTLILHQPDSVANALAGAPQPMGVVTNMTPAPSGYLWYEVGGTGYPINLTDHFTVSPVKTTGYYVDIQNACSAARSQVATIHVTSCADINIAAQPQDAFTSEGDPATTLTMTASAASILNYQWYQGESGDTSVPLSGQTGASLTIQPPITTKYWVRISQPAFGSCAVDSRTATIFVCRTPVFQRTIHDSVRNGETYPNVGIPAPGALFWIAAEATGDEPLTFQWFEGSDNTDESRPIGSTATVAVTPFNTTMYWCKVTSPCTGKPNASAKILPFYASAHPSIDTQPVASTTVMPNTTATLSVAASGTYLRYEWRAGVPGGNSPVLGTSATFTTPPITAATQFYCRVYSGMSYTDSDPASVDLCSGPSVYFTQITTQVKVGQGQLITVNYAPTAYTTVTYYAGQSGDVAHSTLLSGPTSNAGFSLPAATVTTSYWVRAQNGICYSDTPTTTVNVCIPTITTQPVGTTVNAGTAVDLGVAADTVGITYQWYEGNAGDTSHPVAAPGGQLATYHFTPTYTANYWVRVTGTCGVKADSNVVTVTVCAPPAITVQPAHRIITRGQTTSVSVVAAGTNLTYQWYQGAAPDATNPISAATAASMNVSPVNTTNYWVKITGFCGTINSSTVQVSVTPIITVQPSDVPVTKGSGANLSVTVDGTPIFYQWYRGAAGDVSTPICTNSPSCTTPPVTVDTPFWVRVRSGMASTDSNVATAHVCVAPDYSVNQPTNQQSNANVTISLVNPDATHTFAWYNGASGNTSSLIVSGQATSILVHPTQTSSYWYRDIGPACSADSATINIPICVPAITAQPANASINQGANATLTVAATGNPTLTYQWYTGTSGNIGAPVAGATSASLTVSPATTTSYWVRVTSSEQCWINSNTATVTVCNLPAISQQPTSPIISRGQSTTIGVTATGTGVSYQWYIGAAGVTTTPTGGNSNVLTVTPSNTTSYWVRISGCSTSVNSNAGVVNVYPVITAQPANARITKNTSANFTVTTDSSPVTYQWYRGLTGDTTNLISGATSATYTTPALAVDTNYWVRLTSGTAVTASNTVAATICTSSTVNVNSTQVSGSLATLTIATPNAGETYSWYQGTSGTTTTPILLNTAATSINVFPTQSTNYWVRTFSATCSSDGATTQVPICYPKVNTPTGNLSINSSQSTTLSVTATGTPTLTYQWYTGTSGNTTSPVSGGTGSSVTVSPGSTTSYWVRVTSSVAGGCMADSPAVTVAVCQLPNITTQPQPQQYPNSTFSRFISVVATGTGLSYQWYEGTAGVTTTPVGTNASQIAITPGVTKYYWVRVSNACGSVDSVAALQSVAPTITSLTADATICSGTSKALAVSAYGAMMTYQWYQTTAGTGNDMTHPVGTPNSTTFTTPALTANAYYWVRITSGNNYTNSPNINLTVDPGPSISGPWYSVVSGSCWRLQVLINNGDPADYTFQWYRGNAGDTSVPITNTDNWVGCGGSGTKYWVRVTNPNTGCYTNSTAVTIP